VTVAQPTAPAEPDYGPSLPQIVRPWLRRRSRLQRLALGLAVVLLIAGAAALAIRSSAEVKSYQQTESDASDRGLNPIEFRFDHSRKLKLSKPPGAYVRAERRRNGELVGSMTVAPFRMARRDGFIAGYLPLVATDLQRDAARRYDNFRLQFEGRARVNDVEGYQFAFTARLARAGGGEPRQLFGRIVVLPEPYDYNDPAKEHPAGQNPTRGLLITMLATTLDAPDSPTRVGDEGILQKPFRSFRFGS
jgi:hypothetical protein